MKKYSYLLLSLLTPSWAAAMPSPVSVWSAEGNATDSVGTNNGSTNATSYAPGKIGQAFSFNGYTSYVLVGDSVTLDRPNVTNAISVCAWIKWDGVPKPDLCPILRKAVSYGVANYPWMTYDFVLGNNGALVLNLSDGSSGGQIAGVSSSAGAITAGQWYFVAATYDGAQAKVYVNGVLAGTAAVTLHVGNREGPLYIGATSPFANNNNFGGLIDEVELYDQALSVDDIRFVGGFNLAPHANAGIDQIVYIGNNAQGDVTLHGSGSTDPENDALTYSWSGNSVSATGVSPTVTLPPGIYMIDLTVTDTYGQTSKATVHVAVVSGVDATGYAQLQNSVQTLTAQTQADATTIATLTAQTQADATTIATLTQKNANLIALLQSLLPAFDQIQAAAATIHNVSEQKKGAINSALSGN
jgi:hypothetical protein